MANTSRTWDFSTVLGCGRQAAPVFIPFDPAQSAAAASLPEAKRLYFVAGEKLTWDVSLFGVEGGRPRLPIGEPGLLDGKPVLQVTAEAESSGFAAAFQRMHDSVSSWIDVETGVPTRTESAAEQRGKPLLVKTIRRQGEPWADLRMWLGDAPEVRRAVKLPADTQDPLSAILLLRSWAAPLGARSSFCTLGGMKLWRTELVVSGREVVSSPLGERVAVRISAVSRRLLSDFRVDRAAKSRSFTLWLSDDADRIPLRVQAKTEFGDIEVRATSYERARLPVAVAVRPSPTSSYSLRSAPSR